MCTHVHSQESVGVMEFPLILMEMSVVLAHQDPGQEEEGDAPCNEQNQITEEEKKTLCKMPMK